MADRLQKLMSQAGLGSRRHNEILIAEGRVRVNGRIAHLGDRADPEKDKIEVNGRPLLIKKHIYIKLNKPKGVLSSTEDELGLGRVTVRDLVTVPGHIYPVGRLDKQSEGLILLTNNGALANRLTHPRYRHQKEYRVTVEGHISLEAIKIWRYGLLLDGRKTAPARIEVTEIKSRETQLKVTLQEGRKRQIRRIAASFGHPVTRLVRERIGPLTLGTLRSGEWQHLTEDEISQLLKIVDRPKHKQI